MNTEISTPYRSLRKPLQIASLVLLLISGAPCLFTLINIPPVAQYSIDTDQNAVLSLILPLLCAGTLNGLGILLLFISFFIHDRPRTV